MMDKSREVKEQNRLRDWRRYNDDEIKQIIVHIEKSKKIVTQATNSSKQKGLRTNFSSSTSY